MIAAPVAAQNAATQELRDLIPDSAVADPESWANQGVPADVANQEDAPPEVDADSPLAELPEMDIAWPDNLELPEITPLEPETDIQFVDFDSAQPQVEIGSEERISEELVLVFPTDTTLFPQRDEFLSRFRALSTIEQLNAEGSVGRLAAQSREDEALLERMLRVYGYYDAQVFRSVGRAGPDAQEGDPQTRGEREVRFEILPGKQYRFGAIDLGQLPTTGADYGPLRDGFGIETGDPLLADKIEDEQIELGTALSESGYPFAEIGEPDLLIDHQREEGDLTLPVTPGGKYRFGRVISNREDFLSSNHISNMARFEPGDTYKLSLEEDLRQAILATGIVGSVEMSTVEATPPANGEPGTVDVNVNMTEAKLRTITGGLGYGTGEGFKAQASWEHRNLFPPEGALRVRGIVGTREQLLGAVFRRGNLGGRDRNLTAEAFVSTIDYDAYDAQTVSFVANYERRSTLLFQKPLSWSAGVELVATGEAPRLADGTLGERNTYFIGALPASVLVDTSNDLLDPTSGFRLGGRISPEISTTGGVQRFYIRGQIDGSYYLPAGEKVVIAARARFATISGAPVEGVAPSRRLYAGGGGSVRGYGYRAIGPQNSEGDPTGGRSLTELSLEARIRTGLFDGALGVVPFVDAGTVGNGSTPGFDEIKIGAGIGVRYYTSFGPMRVDFAVPLNRGPNDDRFAVYVALGQTF
ncbi:BamA/TamA family outer membrane protein [Altererythrobacter xixiisoli]|uniref:BamA/TamA family outer membrane protein n=1 Tax=Croceibacterium xixiisoli TaxID=1476466 RepID=A0A6I4TTH6_9SPHN|nr:BamA/TamA family outer membrane protein [Croceibacterium xixiisoli]MXO98167.1 BamA/TamA family outer membrane protein [Croceibacterium xixiisoli]